MDVRNFAFLLLALSVVGATSPYLVIVDSTTMDYTLGDTDTTYMDETKAGLGSFVDSSQSDIGIIYTDDCDTWGDTATGGVRLIQPITGDKAALHGAIDTMVTTDKKPSMGSALMEAKSYLESSGQKANIIIMAYDLGSCGNIDPVEVAGEIYGNGNGVGRVSVIGFMSTGGSGEVFAKEIAAAGGGKYYHMEVEGDAANALAGIPQLTGTGAASGAQGGGTGAGPQTGSQGAGICPSGFILLPLAALVFLRQRAG